MKVKEALANLTAMIAHAGNIEDELQLVIKVHSPGSIGGTPCKPVAGIHAGFDWDAGKAILHTEQKLTTLSAEEVAAIEKSVAKGQSWHAYQQYKLQRERIKALEKALTELVELQGPQTSPETLVDAVTRAKLLLSPRN